MNATELNIKVVVLVCSNETCRAGRPKLSVPQEMVVDSSIRPGIASADYDGFFISPYGFAYCSRECWVRYCDD